LIICNELNYDDAWAYMKAESESVLLYF